MSTSERPIDLLREALQERAKELNCLYEVDEILSDPATPLEQVAERLVHALPPGWKYPDACSARIVLRGLRRQTPNFVDTAWSLSAPIIAEDAEVGVLSVHYTEEKPVADEGPFLKEERKLLNTIAERVAFFLTRRNLRRAHDSLQSVQADQRRAEWGAVLDFLRGTDPHLLRRITRRMINHLGLTGVSDAEALLHKFISGYGSTDYSGDNVPLRKAQLQDLAPVSEETFRIASDHLSEKEIVTLIRGWIEEERSSFLIEVLEDQNSPLPDIVEAIGRHRSQIGDVAHLPTEFRRTLSASLLRRLFTDETQYINVAKEFVDLEDVYDLINRIIYPSLSHGKLGGKSAGMFLAHQILRREAGSCQTLRDVRVPKSWYVSSDAILEFLKYNNLRELYSRKYMDLEQVRQEYPHIVQLLKNSFFPPEISRGLALVLDDFEEQPLIVRSSSLLEDRMGSSFAGKYKSLFLANQGTRKERLGALQDAIAEIYASTFGPDPIEYRAERGLLDVHEEMGILIQEVVGRRVGRYFLPAFSGVAFSRNEFRWSARIRREDGLVRLVPGLGTRAVDRVGDDYPVLLAPGQPKLRVNVTPEEVQRYSPRCVDVINLEMNTFETIDLRGLLRELGSEYPAIRRLVSIAEENRIRRPSGLEPDFERDDVVVTFEGLIGETSFVQQLDSMLKTLHAKLGKPVDLEFASDGEQLYVLQCRAQSSAEQFAPVPIPRNLSPEIVLFSARRNISNGRIPEITHIVYVDPDRYAELADPRQLQDVGRAVGKLNKLLPKRQFILMGPGRWGSRGDIRLGVRVGYADLSNTAVLMEIAQRKGNYVPELSFGTHFFQDLVEADIRYIPLYPDEPPALLNEAFFRGATNMLPEMLPEFAAVADALRVVDVARETGGRILRILMNADLDEAIGFFDLAGAGAESAFPRADLTVESPSEAHWRWRLRMAEKVAEQLDADRFGVKALYVFGSVKNATAGPNSDIDLLVHDEGAGPRRERLSLWLEGWGRSLAEMNFLRTGYTSDDLLDVHYVTDEDIAGRTSYAAKIGAVTDPARPLALGRPARRTP